LRLPARLLTAVVLICAALSAVGGAALGARLGERASRPGHDELVLLDPALAGGNADLTLRSAGGFTGFDGPGSLDGGAVRVGSVGAVQNGAFDVTSAGASLAIRATANTRLFRIRHAAAPLQAADVVVVRTRPDGSAAGILRVPRDLNEGTGRPTPSGTPAATSSPGR